MKTLVIGQKLRIDGTDKWVEILKINGNSATYKGENISGTLNKDFRDEWSCLKSMPLVTEGGEKLLIYRRRIYVRP